jgi:sugar/nucleoside kinase (ribokinase family)
MDVLGRPRDAFEPATSCPGFVVHRPGGVARNVACLIGRAGATVEFASVVGDDASGRALVAGLGEAGVGVASVTALAGRRTGTYLAIHDEAGELLAAVSDLWIYDEFVLPPAVFDAPDDAIVFADANIPESALTALAGRFGERLTVDAISRAKAPKLRPLVGLGATLICNLPSVARLVGFEAETPRLAAEALGDMGARRAIVTGGARPIAVLDGGRIEELRPEPVEVVDVTGVGDAQAAGLMLARSSGRSLVEATRVGMLAARAALGNAGALSSLPESVLAALAG